MNGKAYSIISDLLGTPILAVDSEGNEVWNRQLDIYGRVKREIKASSLGDDVRPFIPFLYQGQYYDFETNLAYNRYRYYSPEIGAYISQDPIRLNGNNPNLYGYVKDSNWWVDIFGLAGDRWMYKTKLDGTPYKKPGPKPKGEGEHNLKRLEIIERETKAGSTLIGGGIDGKGKFLPEKIYDIPESVGSEYKKRRMDLSFQRKDGTIYHINIGVSLKDGKTGIARERSAIEDMRALGEEVHFESYGRSCDKS